MHRSSKFPGSVENTMPPNVYRDNFLPPQQSHYGPPNAAVDPIFPSPMHTQRKGRRPRRPGRAGRTTSGYVQTKAVGLFMVLQNSVYVVTPTSPPPGLGMPGQGSLFTTGGKVATPQQPQSWVLGYCFLVAALLCSTWQWNRLGALYVLHVEMLVFV